MALRPHKLAVRRLLRTWARLKAGVAPAAAQTELDVLTDRLALDRSAEPRRLALRDPFDLPGCLRSGAAGDED